MGYAFEQGWLDSLCGMYSIVNAEKLVNNSTDDESQCLFNSIIEYLAKKRQLKDFIIDGMNHQNTIKILDQVVGDRIPLRITNKKNVLKLSHWWKETKDFLSLPNRSVILSLDGREVHYTTIQSMTDRTIYLADSGGIKIIRRNSCRLKGYDKKDKYVIYPSQCIYLGRE